jgi:hypothetical protein
MQLPPTMAATRNDEVSRQCPPMQLLFECVHHLRLVPSNPTSLHKHCRSSAFHCYVNHHTTPEPAFACASATMSHDALILGLQGLLDNTYEGVRKLNEQTRNELARVQRHTRKPNTASYHVSSHGEAVGSPVQSSPPCPSTSAGLSSRPLDCSGSTEDLICCSCHEDYKTFIRYQMTSIADLSATVERLRSAVYAGSQTQPSRRSSVDVEGTGTTSQDRSCPRVSGSVARFDALQSRAGSERNSGARRSDATLVETTFESLYDHEANGRCDSTKNENATAGV